MILGEVGCVRLRFYWEKGSSKGKEKVESEDAAASSAIPTSNPFSSLRDEDAFEVVHECDDGADVRDVHSPPVCSTAASTESHSQAMVVYTGSRTFQHPLGQPVGDLRPKVHELLARHLPINRLCFRKW